MFDNIKEFFRTIFRSRLLVAATVMVLLFSVLIFRMFQLQIIKGTQLAEEYCREPFKLYTADEYIDLCIRYLERLRSDIIVERFVSQSPADMLIAPKWGLKNYEFTNRLVNEMKRRGTWQGRLL